MTFGTKLQNLRKSKNMSQEDLAEILNVSRQAISKWELDQSLPDTSNIIRISKIFNVTTDYLLLDNSDNPQSSKSLQPDKTKSFIMLLVGIFSAVIGFSGIFVLYIISRFIKAPVSVKVKAHYGDFYNTIYVTDFTKFISHFHLWLVFLFFLILMLLGIAIIIYKYRHPIKAFLVKLYGKLKPFFAKFFKRKNKAQTPPCA